MLIPVPARWRDRLQAALQQAITDCKNDDLGDGGKPEREDAIVMVALLTEDQVTAALVGASTEQAAGENAQAVTNLLCAVVHKEGGAVRLAIEDIAAVEGAFIDSKQDGNVVMLTVKLPNTPRLVVAGRVPIDRIHR